MKTLHRLGHELSVTQRQLNIIQDSQLPILPFDAKLREKLSDDGLRRRDLEIIQVNVGKVCNQTCNHCHVDAGPDRKERMTRDTAEQVIELLANSNAHTLDITGGAPELNENFCYFVEQARRLNRQVIDRCNLTILEATGYEWLAEFLARHQVKIVASLPCYLEENCDAQRGSGTFAKSIAAIKRLNAWGYGLGDPAHQLALVYNPVGTGLPPSQSKLESDYKRELKARYDVQFDQLYTITNMPISRFLADLVAKASVAQYMQKLADNFNPATIEDLMCRNTLSIDWEGYLYDCDFNQMLGLTCGDRPRLHVADVDLQSLSAIPIAVRNHCYGCTAGAGSSCQGALS